MGFLADAASDSNSDDETVNTESGDSTDNSTVKTEDTNLSAKPEGAPVKLSRRQEQRAKSDALTSKLDEMTKTFGESQKAWETKFQQLSEENARSRGAFEALTRQQQIQGAQQQPAAKTPAQMRKEAQAALDAGRFDEWQDGFANSIVEQMRGLIPQQQSQQEGPNPMVMAMMSQFPAVVNAGERGRQLAIIKDMELATMGVPDGPERYRKAFELAANQLGGAQPQAPQFSQQSRGALAGISSRNGSQHDTSGPGIVLSAYEREVARKCGMSPEEYAGYLAEAQPDRVKNA